MQRLKKCLGIDIGASSVKVAEMVADKSGVRVTKLVRADLNLPPGPMDTMRIEAVGKAVRDLLRENRIATRQAVFCVPGQSVFIRRIRVPRTTEERLHRIVQYEARQQIPFALDNSSMEYQVFDYGDAAEVEVLLVAVKKDIINEFMKVVNKTGVKPLMISVSSLALFNFYAFDTSPWDEFQAELARSQGKKVKITHTAAPVEPPAPEEPGEEAEPVVAAAPEKKKFGLSLKLPKIDLSFGKKKGGDGNQPAETETLLDTDEGETGYEEVRAYVNVGAATFDLAITRHGRHKIIGFTRSVPWAGNELSRSLQEKLGLDSPIAAEEVKRTRAMVVIPGREEEIEETGADADASEFTTSWADRLIIDLRKSFDFYISQPDGMAVDGIALSGGQSMLRNLPLYIEDKLGIPVEVKSQPENAAMKIQSDLGDEGITPFVIALGLGMTGVGLGQTSIDFLPSELKTIREFKKKNIEMFLLMGAIAGMLLISTQVGNRRLENMETWLKQNRTKIESAQETEATIKKARDDRIKIDSSLTVLGGAMGERSFWLQFMGMIEGAKPADVVITSFKMKPSGEVEIRGETTVVSSISDFANKLKAQAEWVQNVDLSAIDQGFSQFIGKQVSVFTVKMNALWKKTRLEPARRTLPPGMLTPSPTPTGTPMPQLGPGAPGMEFMI